MSQNEEYSKGGSQIHRYSEKDFRQTFDDLGDPSIEEIDSHITKFVGNPETVLHEVVSPTVHVDIHVIRPTPTRNFYTLVTSGMSDKPMNSPFKGLEYAELVICLPPTWELSEQSIFDERNYWPIRQLKYLARLPHEFDTWIWATHTIPNGDPPVQFADNTKTTGVLLAYPRLFGEEFWTLKINPSKEIHFLGLMPIYTEEMNLKLELGVEALYKRFTENNICELLKIDRPNLGLIE